MSAVDDNVDVWWRREAFVGTGRSLTPGPVVHSGHSCLLAGAPPRRTAADRAAPHGCPAPGAGGAGDAGRYDGEGVDPAAGDRGTDRVRQRAVQPVDLGPGQLVDRAGRVDLGEPQDLVGQQVADA